MRILHVADWRLGRAFHGTDLSADLAAALSGLVGQIEQYRPDVVLVAGSLYEHSSPSRAVIELSDDFLCRVVLDMGIPVVLQAGHADRAERITVGARLLTRAGLHVVDAGFDPSCPIELSDEHGPVHVHAVPNPLPSREQGLEATLGRIRASRDESGKGVRSILLACGWLAAEHAPAGLSLVAEHCLEGFSYLALGGLRRPALALGGRARQPGGLMPEGFGDAADSACVNLVEMDARGKCEVQRLELSGLRRFRTVEGTLSELLALEASEDYLHARVTDLQPLVDPRQRLRAHFPNLLEIHRPAPAGVPGKGGAVLSSLFAEWFRGAAGGALDAGQQEVVARCAASALESGLAAGEA